MRAFHVLIIFCLTALVAALFPTSASSAMMFSQDKSLIASHASQVETGHELFSASEVAQGSSALGPLFVNPDNPRYFTDGTKTNGKYNVVFLTGSHTWCNFMDCDDNASISAKFDYTGYLNFLQSKNHNFFRLWRAENVRGGEAGDNFWFSPMPYQRSTTVCCAFDGKNKFNLNQFNQAYFDRMRERVIAAGDRGIYVSILLFDGWSVEHKCCDHQPWKGHPYRDQNNINGVDGDTNNDTQGGETHTLVNGQVTALQEAYVRKVIDTVNDLDNVLYEISNESTGNADVTAWQYHMINYIKDYEATKPQQHPVGMTWQWPNGSNTDLFASPADWIAPGENSGDALLVNPLIADGSKVIIADTDHLCGICGNRQWVWKSFTRGQNPIFMDIYDNATSGRGMPFTNANEVEIRNNLGYARSYATRMNLTAMTPTTNTSLCSTGYCLRNAVANGAEYLVYNPNNGNIAVDLSAVSLSKTMNIEWFNPVTGATISGGTINGGATRVFTPPFSGDSVLYIYEDDLLATFNSEGTNDGWLLESSETSGQGGALNGTASTLNLGDNTSNKQCRAILSFDTSSLPDNAVITSVTLKFKYAGKTGTSPFSTHGNLLVDIYKGAFSDNSSLQLSDFKATASKMKVLAFTSTKVDNWYSKSFNSADLQFINLGGVTQFRLRFTKDDNNDFGADLLKIYSGNADTSNQPQLVIKYYVP